MVYAAPELVGAELDGGRINVRGQPVEVVPATARRLRDHGVSVEPVLVHEIDKGLAAGAVVTVVDVENQQAFGVDAEIKVETFSVRPCPHRRHVGGVARWNMLVVSAFRRPWLVRRLRRGFGPWFDRQYPKSQLRQCDCLVAHGEW